MTWFIAAFTIATAIFLFGPKEVSDQQTQKHSELPKQLSLLLLPVIMLAWFAVTQLNSQTSMFDIVALGFVLSACSIALPTLRRFILPCAGLTSVALIAALLVNL
ncbi:MULTISPECIES: hypothetical protein [Shewanella]|uniref:hypothetical protein n=1 Tax=Shewanella TaxID=22 RepID=UPI00048CF332|nr:MULTISPECIES: hypothetical protein [Shewanella]QLE84694.1 hypothetical protein FLM48_06065 [Shewanella sp. Scap07]